jgi:hypothetical protein
VGYVPVQDRHDGTRRIYRMHGVKIGAGIGTDCVWVRKAIKNLVTWSKNFWVQ